MRPDPRLPVTSLSRILVFENDSAFVETPHLRSTYQSNRRMGKPDCHEHAGRIADRLRGIQQLNIHQAPLEVSPVQADVCEKREGVVLMKKPKRTAAYREGGPPDKHQDFPAIIALKYTTVLTMPPPAKSTFLPALFLRKFVDIKNQSHYIATRLQAGSSR